MSRPQGRVSPVTLRRVIHRHGLSSLCCAGGTVRSELRSELLGLLYNVSMASEYQYQYHDLPTLGTYTICTYGCQMNAHESEKIAGTLEQLGLRPAAKDSPPDLIVVNTCCIRDSAEQRILGHIGTLRQLKEEHPRLVIAVVGCLSEQADAAGRIRRSFPFVDIVLGTSNIAELPERLARAMKLDSPAASSYDESVVVRADGPAAYVNAMYGCNNFCSYCIVPFVRGRERSRDEEAILAEIRALCDQGFREVTLLGQNVNSFQGGGDRFADLLRRVADETAVDRIRFMTSHPKDMSRSLVDAVRDYPKICSHVHLPVQSGSDRILRSMNRHYTRSDYLELVGLLRREVPDIAVTTDVIVGYPGEDEQDFRDTMDLMQTVRFDGAYTFVYSPRAGTKAAALPLQVGKQDKKERIMQLINLQKQILFEINSSRIGRLEEVLVERRSARTDSLCGRTDGARMVNFEGDDDLCGRIVPVRISEVRGSTLFGVVEGAAS